MAGDRCNPVLLLLLKVNFVVSFVYIKWAVLVNCSSMLRINIYMKGEWRISTTIPIDCLSFQPISF